MAKTLKEMVGKNLQIDLLADGFKVTNGAGFASYDAQGCRTTVNGIPEYFPETITVSGWDSVQAKPDEISVKLTMDTSDFDEKFEQIDELIRSTGAFEILQGQGIINKARISDGFITYHQKNKVAVNNEDPSDSLIPLIRSVIKNELRPGGLLSRK